MCSGSLLEDINIFLKFTLRSYSIKEHNGNVNQPTNKETEGAGRGGVTGTESSRDKGGNAGGVGCLEVRL